jgi:DNA (cytosine-5)-methyltransferase 1
LSGVEAQPEVSRTILAAAGESGNNQPCVVTATDIGFFNSIENVSPSLLARGYKDPHLLSYPDEVREFVGEHNSDVEHQQDRLQLADGPARTLAAGTHGMASHLTKTVINKGNHYIVRRLTPIECARLQGFPDSWGWLEPKESFSDEEYRFWLEVRKTHAAINGKQVKDYTEKQMLSWYNKLHTDSAEYKMWGNGIALPCAVYVMQGIAAAIEKTEKKTA